MKFDVVIAHTPEEQKQAEAMGTQVIYVPINKDEKENI